jgi:hypothetical protein
MKLPRMGKDDKITVIWVDTFDLCLSTWGDDEEITKSIKSQIKWAISCGFFYCEDKTHIYIYGDRFDKQYSRLIGIPKGCIIKIEMG